MGTAARIQDLLSTGQVRRASAAPDRLPATWSLSELSGRVIELSGGGRGATAVLTAAVDLVLKAQQKQEPVAWITPPDTTVFPPDVAQHGIDLDALLFVRVETATAMLRAADHLLRSGAFGLVILDLPARIDVPLPAQVRLAGLAKRHEAVLVYLGSADSSLVSLRAASHRQRLAAGRFECQLHITKDKRWGQEWHHAKACHGAVGLR